MGNQIPSSLEPESYSFLEPTTECNKFERNFIIGPLIGSGQFSKVHLCNRKQTREKYAVKIIPACISNPRSVARITEEIEIMTALKEHPYLVRLLGVDKSYNPEEGKIVVKLLLDLCEGGDLLQYVNYHGPIAEPLARVLISKLVHGLKYVHDRNIIHRDLKPDNILLVSQNSNATDVKISDFGLAKRGCHLNSVPRSTSLCGSDFYLAPEILLQKEYGPEVDMWGLGVISYIVLCGELPFNDNEVPNLYQKIVERDIQSTLFSQVAWSNISQGARIFIQELLSLDCSRRMTSRQACTHRWLRGAISIDELKSLPNTGTKSHESSARQISLPEISKTTTRLRSTLAASVNHLNETRSSSLFNTVSEKQLQHSLTSLPPKFTRTTSPQLMKQLRSYPILNTNPSRTQVGYSHLCQTPRQNNNQQQADIIFRQQSTFQLSVPTSNLSSTTSRPKLSARLPYFDTVDFQETNKSTLSCASRSSLNSSLNFNNAKVKTYFDTAAYTDLRVKELKSHVNDRNIDAFKRNTFIPFATRLQPFDHHFPVNCHFSNSTSATAKPSNIPMSKAIPIFIKPHFLHPGSSASLNVCKVMPKSTQEVRRIQPPIRMITKFDMPQSHFYTIRGDVIRQ